MSILLFVLAAAAAYLASFTATATVANPEGARYIARTWVWFAIGAAVLALAGVAALLASRR